MFSRKPRHRQANRARLGGVRLRRVGMTERTPHDEAKDLIVRNLVDSRGALDLAIAHDCDPISDLTDFLEAVRDVNDGRASRRRRPDLLEQQLDKIGGERCSGLVKDQHLGFNSERFRKFVELTLGDIDFAHPRPRIDRRSDPLKLRSDPFPAAAAPQIRRDGEKHIFGDRQFWQHGRVLVNDGEAEMLRLGWGESFDGCAADLDRASIRTHHARSDAHQG